jgi:putative membrane protein
MNAIAHWGGGSWPVFPVMWGLFWVAVVAVVITARRRGWWGPHRQQAPASPTAPAEQILAERYARGEMSDDEYFEKMSVLRGGSS